MTEISGVKLNAMSDPIREALGQFSEQSEGAVTFDQDAAARLKTTSGSKPYSASSSASVYVTGEAVGEIHIIAFAPEDGTGNEGTFRLTDNMLGPAYPPLPKVVPRSKEGTHTEAHLALASFFPYSENDPIMLANHLDLVSLRGGRIVQLAHLGQNTSDFGKVLQQAVDPEPTATLTVGYRATNGERFGDPHAVFNNLPFVQVAGFLAATGTNQGATALRALRPVEPELRY